jgi:hypothetical protein
MRADGNWNPYAGFGGNQPKATASTWSHVSARSDPAPIQRGDSRWLAGITIISIGAVLALSSFADWYSESARSAEYRVNGVMGLSYAANEFNYQPMQMGVLHPGVGALLVGLLAVGAGVAFLRTVWRGKIALAIAIVGGIEFLVCLNQAVTASATMLPITGEDGLVSIGMGLFFACALAFILSAIGLAAFIFERISRQKPSAGSEKHIARG